MFPPAYLEKADELKQGGISDVFVYALNGGFVKDGGGEFANAISDSQKDFARALGLALLESPDHGAELGMPSCQGFSILIEDGIIKAIDDVSGLEEDLDDPDVTVQLVENLIGSLNTPPATINV